MHKDTHKIHPYSGEEKVVRAHFLRDLKYFADEVHKLDSEKESALTPKADWDTVWVFSGPEKTLDAGEHEDERGNQTKERFETGFHIMRSVAAVRANKKEGTLTPEDIEKFAPTLYFNGGPEWNVGLREYLASGELEEKWKIPRSLVRITDNEAGITNTLDQFADFPTALAPTPGRKLVMVSDLYHLPRIKRYFSKKYPNIPVADSDVVFYPTHAGLRVGRAVSEAKKIFKYIEAGDLPEEWK